MDEINSDGNKALESLPGKGSSYRLQFNLSCLELLYNIIVVEKLDKVSEIDYTLLSAPVCTASYVETNHKVLRSYS